MRFEILVSAPLTPLTPAERAVRFSPYRTCVICQSQFKAIRFDAIYCSGRCRSRAFRARKSEQQNNHNNQIGA